MDGREREAMEPGEGPVLAPGRGVRVGTYEGLRAGEAIVAVRELGLRPSLERVEGYAEDQHGFVVSQEPVVDCEVAADSQVFLYIGAPARAVAGSAATRGVEEEEEEEEEEGGRDADSASGEWDERDEDEAAGAEPAPVDELGSVDELAPVEEPGSVEEQEPVDEPTRVWRGPAPGSGLRRGFAQNAGGWDRDESTVDEAPRASGWLAGVPLGVKVAAFGLLACAVLTLLVSMAARSGGGTISGRGVPATGIAAGSRPVRGGSARRFGVAPRPVGRAAGRWRRRPGRAREARPVKEVVRVVVVRAPAGMAEGEAAVTSVPSASELRAAEEEHAAREFGP